MASIFTKTFGIQPPPPAPQAPAPPPQAPPAKPKGSGLFDMATIADIQRKYDANLPSSAGAANTPDVIKTPPPGQAQTGTGPTLAPQV